MPAYPGLPPRIRLTYFDIPGPVEAVRLAFYISGIDFEDERVSREEFSLLKPGEYSYYFQCNGRQNYSEYSTTTVSASCSRFLRSSDARKVRDRYR